MRLRVVTLLVAASFVATSAAAAPARAADGDTQSPSGTDTPSGTELEAAELESQARQDFSDGNYEEAAEGFARAHQLSPAAITKYNEAFSWQKAGRLSEQADAYSEALAIGTLDGERTSHARERLTELSGRLGVLVVRKPAGAKVYVAHAQGREVPARVHLPPGEHDVVLRAGKSTLRESVAIEAGEQRFMAVDAAAFTDGEADQGGSAPWQTIAGWSAVAAGGLFGISAVATGAAFLGARSDFVDAGQTDAEQRQQAIDLRLATNITAGAAVLLGGAGLTLLLLAPEDDDGASAAGELLLLPTGLAWRASW